METLLKNGHIVSSKEIIIGDLLIKEGKIDKIGDNINAPGAEEIDCTNKYILPGIIDAHVHFRSPGYEEEEDWETGSSAALAGGVTTVFDMPNTNPKTVTLKALDQKKALAKKKSHVNFRFFMGATGDNIEEINKAGDDVIGVKVYMGQTTGQTVKDDGMEKLLKNLFEQTNKIIAVHAEDEEMIEKRMKIYHDENSPEIHSLIRNDAVAFTATKKAVHLAKKYRGRLHICHLSTKKEVELLRKYKDITCEVAPHHLFFTVAEYAKQGNFVKVNPPIRSQNDVDALWEGLLDGTINIIATDHAPHLRKDKETGYWQAPAGMPGVEFVLPLMLDSVNKGRITLKDIIRLMCEGPARIYGLHKKGFLKEGFDADIVIIDMDIKREIRNEDVVSKCGWTPYAGRILQGWPVMTFVRGNLLVENGKIVSGQTGAEVPIGT